MPVIFSHNIIIHHVVARTLISQYAYDSESEETEEYEQPSGSKKLKSTPTSHILADRTNKVAPVRMLLHNRKEVNPVQKTQVESIMGAIGKTNKLLSSVIDRMDKQETRMCQLEQKIDASSSLSSSASSTPVSSRRKEVPLQVRVSVIVTNYSTALGKQHSLVIVYFKLWAASVMVILYGILINCCSVKHAESIPCLWMKILITSMDGQLEMGEFDIYFQFPINLILMNIFRCQSTHCPRLSLQYSHSHNTLQATCFIFLRAGVEAVPLYIEAHRKVINSVCMNADLYTYP